MFLVRIVIAVCVCAVINQVLGGRRESEKQTNSAVDDDEKTESDVDIHTFVALIDIVFTDLTKRTCTGTIIHDSVVITAAHCFVIENRPDIIPELTASFVVIGTKKMFDAKYEQYLPIERIVTHPKFKGWTADLALVYTFSGMTSDKPGTIVPLDGERTSTPVDSNVTVLSWGHFSKEILKDESMSKFNKKERVTKMYKNTEDCDESNECETGEVTRRPLAKYDDSNEYNSKNYHRGQSDRYRQTRSGMLRIAAADIPKVTGSINNLGSRMDSQIHHLSLGEDGKEEGSKNANKKKFVHQRSGVKFSTKNSKESRPIFIMRASKENHDKRIPLKTRSFRSVFKNWRRSMGSQSNQLTVEVFGFVNMNACKKIVEKAMPAIYEIKDSNDVVCYASEEHYITAEDSGAPAIRQGHLVAVTVGGAECDGDHVAIGMKMSCYCAWIAANLPSGASEMKCCKNCCDVTHKGQHSNGDQQQASYKVHSNDFF